MNRNFLILIAISALVIIIGGALVFSGAFQPINPPNSNSPSPTNTAIPTSQPTPSATTQPTSAIPTSSPTSLPTNTPSTPSPSPQATPSPSTLQTPIPTTSPLPNGNVTQITVNIGSMARYDFNGTIYFFYYPTVNSILVEHGGLYQNFTAAIGGAYQVFDLQVIVSDIQPAYAILSVRPA